MCNLDILAIRMFLNFYEKFYNLEIDKVIGLDETAIQMLQQNNQPFKQ